MDIEEQLYHLSYEAYCVGQEIKLTGEYYFDFFQNSDLNSYYNDGYFGLEFKFKPITKINNNWKTN